MADFINSAGNVCLRRGSGKEYSLWRAVAQLGSALEWGSRGRGFKSRRPERIRCLIVVFHVYILRSSKTGRRYVGSCENLSERLRRHNLGHSKATRHGMPWTLVHSESFSSRRSGKKRAILQIWSRAR